MKTFALCLFSILATHAASIAGEVTLKKDNHPNVLSFLKKHL